MDTNTLNEEGQELCRQKI